MIESPDNFDSAHQEKWNIAQSIIEKILMTFGNKSMKDEYSPILRHKQDNVHVPHKHEFIQDLIENGQLQLQKLTQYLCPPYL